MAPTTVDGLDIDDATIDGTEVSEITVDGNVVFKAGPDIPDSEVYLQDDWGDNRLTNREDSGTTTYNGVEGVYRPEWNTRNGSPEATNERLEMDDADRVVTDINLSFNETITWEFDIDVSNVPSGGANSMRATLFAEQDSDFQDRFYHRGYGLRWPNGQRLILDEVDDNGDLNTIVDGSTDLSGQHTVEVLRNSDGDWEVILDGSSEGTGNDTTHTNEDITAFHSDGDGHIINEVKVY